MLSSVIKPPYQLLSKFTTFSRRQLHKNDASNIEQVLKATPHKPAAIRPPTTHQENYES